MIDLRRPCRGAGWGEVCVAFWTDMSMHTVIIDTIMIISRSMKA